MVVAIINIIILLLLITITLIVIIMYENFRTVPEARSQRPSSQLAEFSACRIAVVWLRAHRCKEFDNT